MKNFLNHVQLKIHQFFFTLTLICFALILSACGGDVGFRDRMYTLSGSVSGLDDGKQLALQNNGQDTLIISTNGTFSFNQLIKFNDSYNITVINQPSDQICSIGSNSGSGAGVTANIDNVIIVCAAAPVNTYTISGSLSGLSLGEQVTLQNNGSDDLVVTSSGNFIFATPVALNGSYNITITSQPNGKTCTVANNSESGAGVTANVNSVFVICAINTYSVGGSISGLGSGQQVTLYNNGSDALTIQSNSGFAFNLPIAFGGSYNVTVGTQPTGMTCSVANNSGSGTGVSANVVNVLIVCSTNTYTIGGTVTGLAVGQQVTLQNNGSDATTIQSNNDFVFSIPIAFNGSYNVTIGTQPVGQLCSIIDNSGSGVINIMANVINVNVVCVNATTSSYNIGGSVTGLPLGMQVSLSNNGTDNLVVQGSGDGSTSVDFTFATSVTSGGSYNVTIVSQPIGFKTCSVTANANRSSVTSDVSNISVLCSASGASASSIGSMQAVNNPAPAGITVDVQGNVFVSQWRDDSGSGDPNIVPIMSNAWGTISKINTSNQQTTFVSGLNDPVGLTFDTSGNMYLIETSSTQIQKVTSNGIASIFVDVNAIDPNINVPAAIYFDRQNNKFYISDQFGAISILTSMGTLIRSITVPGHPSLLGIIVDANENIYVSDATNSRILKIDSLNNVTTFAGSSQGLLDGTGVDAKFNSPYGITIDMSGNLYVADQGNNKIRMVTATGVVSTLNPTLTSGAAATFNAPTGIARDANGALYVTEYYGRGIRKVAPIQP